MLKDSIENGVNGGEAATRKRKRKRKGGKVLLEGKMQTAGGYMKSGLSAVHETKRKGGHGCKAATRKRKRKGGKLPTPFIHRGAATRKRKRKGGKVRIPNSDPFQPHRHLLQV